MSDRRRADISAGKKPASSSRKLSREEQEACAALQIDQENLKRLEQLEKEEEDLEKELKAANDELEARVNVLSRDSEFMVEDSKGASELKAFLKNAAGWRGRVLLKVKVVKNYRSIRKTVDDAVQKYNQRHGQNHVTVVDQY